MPESDGRSVSWNALQEAYNAAIIAANARSDPRRFRAAQWYREQCREIFGDDLPFGDWDALLCLPVNPAIVPLTLPDISAA